MVTKWVNEYLFEPPVTLEGSKVVFTDQNCEMDLSEVTDQSSLLKLVVQLGEQTWTTGAMIGGFVDIVCQAKGWPSR